MGWIIGRYGFSAAFAVGTILCTLSVPYFLAVDPLLRRTMVSRLGEEGHLRSLLST